MVLLLVMLLSKFIPLVHPHGLWRIWDGELPSSVTIPPAGAWLLLDISGVTNQDKYAIRATESPTPPAYDPWLECFKYKSDNSVIPSATESSTLN